MDLTFGKEELAFQQGHSHIHLQTVGRWNVFFRNQLRSLLRQPVGRQYQPFQLPRQEPLT